MSGGSDREARGWGDEQVTFSDVEYEGKKRKTRREVFLERMDGLIPWERLEARIRPFYPKAGRGRRPYPLSVMLRIHCVQLFYDMSDPGMEDLLYEVESVRRFAGLRLSGPIPDETTILNGTFWSATGPGTVRGDQRAPGVPGLPSSARDDRGRDDHRGPFLDEEP